MMEQCFFDGRSCSRRSTCAIRFAWQSENIADDGLRLLVDAEDIAHYAAGRERRVAGKHMVVEILHEQTRRGMVVPVEALLPQLTLRLQHRAQDRGREVSQVKDLDGAAGCLHSSSI